MVTTVDGYSLSFRVDSKDDAVREVDEMPDFKGELGMFRDDGAAFRHFFQGVDGFHQTAEPTLGRFGLMLNIADLPEVLLGVEERGLGDINVEYQV